MSEAYGADAAPEIKKLWKEFGTNTEAGRLLRQLYDGRPPKLAYPKVKTKPFSTSLQPDPPKPCPQKAQVKVPKFGRQKPASQPAFPLVGGKKSYAQILQESAEDENIPDPGPRGKDREMMKSKLQDHHTFGGGNVLPKGAMGNNPSTGGMIQPLPQKAKPAEPHIPGELSKEDNELFEEICASIKQKQCQLDEYDENSLPKASNAHQHNRGKAFRDKEKGRLKHEIAEDMKDLQKILELSNK